MRAFLASSIGVTCAAVLVLPSAAPAGAASDTAPASAEAADPPAVPGSTQSLPMSPLAEPSGPATGDPARAADAVEQGLTEREVRPFSLVGVVWDDPDTELHGTVQVRTRARGTGRWSDWQDLETHNAEHAADPGSTERESGGVRGTTAPLWVGDSDGVAVRVRPEAPGSGTTDRGGRTTSAAPLPAGLRLELVDPGQDPQQVPTGEAEGAGKVEGSGKTEAAGEAEGSGAARTTGTLGTIGTIGAKGAPGAVGAAAVADAMDAAADAASAGSAGSAATSAADAAAAATTEAVRDMWNMWGSADDHTAVPGTTAPGTATPGTTAPDSAARDTASLDASVLPALTEAETEARSETQSGLAPGAQPYIGPRPRIITRKGWGADEKLRERAFVYTKTVKAAFIHHSATGNNYTCAQAPSVLRGIYRYHVKSSGWRDFGYNFAVDKCGNIYEGRAGGVTKPVLGAHTLGFNTNSMGIAVLGTFSNTNPPAAAVNAVAKLTAWKLGLFGADPRGRTTLVSGGGNKFKKGSKVSLHVISGHRDGFATECPGTRLYKKLGSARTSSARLQGR
ncbi:N-acetylmuramoyl-L-alanine amidase [Streptomyces sp. NPDC056061]|uniref:peptidoglycan recognition protein family protein n=1 Tax=Streptomyces sp. NPDC056061 TaxID=3345700 RepID=UPI0035D536BD